MDWSGSEPSAERVFREQIEESMLPPIGFTPRRVRGPLHFPGKATAVIGMRRVGKTTLLHQIRAERAEAGTPMRRLPMLWRTAS